jgi:hypothetical protein
MLRLLLTAVMIVGSAAGALAQNVVNIEDGTQTTFDSSTQNKLYTIKNNGPDESIRIYRRNGQSGQWVHIATLGSGEVHTVTPDAGDQLRATDLADSDSDGAEVEWTITP